MAATGTVILIADDLEEEGRLALEQGLVLASAVRAEVHVVHVATDREVGAAKADSRLEKHDQLLSIQPDRMWKRVNEAGKHPDCRGAVSVTVHVRMGNPVEEIDRIAADYAANLIVVGTHSRKGLERLTLGSVAELLARTAHCPVLVSRPRDFSDVRKSEVPEPPRPGEDMQRQRPEHAHVYRSTQLVTFGDVETHGVAR